MVQNLAPALGKQVTAMPQYSQFQPKPYRPRMSAYWYFDRWPYLRFILREASSFFVAYFAVLMLMQIAALNAGPSAYAKFEACLSTPPMLILNGFTLLFLLLHTVTWFNLVPRVMLREMRGKTMPEIAAAAPGYIAWIGASIIVALFALRII
jgi:fumarate reductase subunit C